MPQPTFEGFVYLMQNGDSEVYKIGRSYNPFARVNQLNIQRYGEEYFLDREQTLSNWSVRRCWPTDDTDSLERALHQVMDRYRDTWYRERELFVLYPNKVDVEELVRKITFYFLHPDAIWSGCNKEWKANQHREIPSLYSHGTTRALRQIGSAWTPQLALAHQDYPKGLNSGTSTMTLSRRPAPGNKLEQLQNKFNVR